MFALKNIESIFFNISVNSMHFWICILGFRNILYINLQQYKLFLRTVKISQNFSFKILTNYFVRIFLQIWIPFEGTCRGNFCSTKTRMRRVIELQIMTGSMQLSATAFVVTVNALSPYVRRGSWPLFLEESRIESLLYRFRRSKTNVPQSFAVRAGLVPFPSEQCFRFNRLYENVSCDMAQGQYTTLTSSSCDPSRVARGSDVIYSCFEL